MPDKNIDDILYKLGELSGEFSEGLKGVHLRLDTLNGKVKRHDEDILEMKLERSFVRGITKVGFVIISFGGGILAFFISLIWDYYKK